MTFFIIFSQFVDDYLEKKNKNKKIRKFKSLML